MFQISSIYRYYKPVYAYILESIPILYRPPDPSCKDAIASKNPGTHPPTKRWKISSFLIKPLPYKMPQF